MKILLALWLLACTAWGQPALGLRNNNPTNLKASSMQACKKWPGCVGLDSQNHMKFRTPVQGIQAAKINLKAYHRKYGINTINRIVNRWIEAPKHPKDPRNYKRAVSDWTGYGVYEPLDMRNPKVLEALTKSIIRYECGIQPYMEWNFQVAFREI